MRRRTPARSPIRLIPYESRLGTAVHGSLAMALDMHGQAQRTGMHGQTQRTGMHGQPQRTGSGPPPTRARPPLGVVRDGRPDLRADARLIARLVFEVLAGVRPYHHLAGRTTPVVFELLDSLAARMPGHSVPRLGTVRVCEVAPDVAEVTALAAFGPRVHALALRLEHDRRWRCAAIETTVPT
jgi:hypothetical protein